MSSFRHRLGWSNVFSLVVFLVIFLTVILTAVVAFSLDATVILLLASAVLFGSIFGELRETWQVEPPFSLERVFFRTFEWLSLAVAGYIILAVIGSNANQSL